MYSGNYSVPVINHTPPQNIGRRYFKNKSEHFTGYKPRRWEIQAGLDESFRKHDCYDCKVGEECDREWQKELFYLEKFKEKDRIEEESRFNRKKLEREEKEKI